MSNTASRFHIELEGIDPPVWRRIRVPGDYTFWDLHVAIQDAMGWLDYHLHLFQVRNPETGALEQIGIPDDEPFLDGPSSLAGWEVPIAGYFIKEGEPASYEYDPPRQASRRSPPEDCGGDSRIRGDVGGHRRRNAFRTRSDASVARRRI